MQHEFFTQNAQQQILQLHNKNILPLVTVKNEGSKKQKSSLQKETEKYNRIVNNLNTLKTEYEQLKEIDKNKKVKYQAELSPLAMERDNAILKFVYSLDHWFSQAKLLKKTARRNIIEIILHELARVAENESTNALKKIYLEHQWDLNTPLQKRGIIEGLEEQGIKIDYKDSSKISGEDFYKNLSTEHNQAKMAGAKNAKDDWDFDYDDELDEMFGNAKSKPRQSHNEQVHVSSLESFFKKLYKKLARLIHPDLEKDDEIRGFKEEVMKELTQVREENNLFQLLVLRARVFAALSIVEEESREDEATLTAQYKMLNRQLGGELDRLQSEVYALKNDHHQWGTGRNGLHTYIDMLSDEGIKMAKTQYKKDIRTYTNYAELLSNATPDEVAEFVSNAV